MKFPSRFTTIDLQQRESISDPSNNGYGRIIYLLRWPLLVLWLVLVLGSLPFVRLVPSILSAGSYTKNGGDASKVEQALIARFHQPSSRLFITLESSTTPVNDPTFQRQIHTIIDWARKQSQVTTVSTNLGNDTRSLAINIGSNQDKNTLISRIPFWRSQLAQLPAGPAQPTLTGDAVVSSDWQYYSEEANKKAELIALPLLFCVLLLVFRNLLASLIPIILAVSAISTAEAILYTIALHLEVSIFALNLLSLVALGLSIDYSLLFIHRFREELAQGRSVEHALAITLTTAGSAIFHSGLMVLLGSMGLLLIDLPLLRSLGLGGICATALAMLASLTLLPALLAILGTRIRRFTLSKGTSPFQQLSQIAWQRWTRMVMARPLPLLLLVLALLISLGLPTLSLKPGLPGPTALPADSQARHGLAVLQTHFPAFNDDSLLLLAQTSDGSGVLSISHLQQLQTMTSWIATIPHVTGVISLTSPPQELVLKLPRLPQVYTADSLLRLPAVKQLIAATTAGDSTLLAIHTDASPGSDEEQALLQHLHAMPPTVRAGWNILIGGTRAANVDFTTTLYTQSLRPLLFLLSATFVALLLMFRSLLLALKAVLMNLLSLSVAFGTLVFVFQQGHFETLLGFTALGNIDRFVPLLLFCLLFGLSMDYEVFLLTRIREEWLRTADNDAAIIYGLEKTGGVITSAALLLAIVSAAFACTSLIVTKEIGLGVTVSVCIDATLIRCLLVPVTMKLLGKWNWWLPTWHLKIRQRKAS